MEILRLASRILPCLATPIAWRSTAWRSVARSNVARTATRAAVGTIVGVVSCAPLLGLEDATCDPTDSSCLTTANLPIMGQAGQGGGAMIPNNSAGAGGSAAGGAAAGGAALGGAGGGAGMGMGGGAGMGMAGAGLGGGAGMGMGGAGGMPIPVDAPDVSSPECVEYCEKIQTVCGLNTGFQQYATETVCLRYCELFELGDTANFAGTNTIACRMEEVLSAEITGEVSEHCPSGGPGGNDVCGSNCDGYCTAMTQKCGQEIPGFEQFAETAECLALCAVVPDLEEDYSTAIQDEDSVQCRLYHVTAATARPGAHCSHASGDEFCLLGG